MTWDVRVRASNADSVASSSDEIQLRKVRVVQSMSSKPFSHSAANAKATVASARPGKALGISCKRWIE